MKWWPGECTAGDIIRVNLGTIWHYGIFVSDDEVIQFGLPPIDEYKLPDNQVKVCSSNIDLFSCGQIIEVGYPSKEESRKKFNAKKVIENARSRMGEYGYSLVHNNCEHFANECYFGVSKCSQQENAIKKWANRQILDIYIGIDSENKMTEYATVRSFGLRLNEIGLSQKKNGKLKCDKFFIAIEHIDDETIIAVSSKPIDIEIKYTDSNSETKYELILHSKISDAYRIYKYENGIAHIINDKKLVEVRK